ncbi:MAG: hypothetical protein GY849_00665 [Deltaproteobacteria bacterium]|nr:hypothetical protein [Deltaproteobacteria bacterium]
MTIQEIKVRFLASFFAFNTGDAPVSIVGAEKIIKANYVDIENAFQEYKKYFGAYLEYAITQKRVGNLFFKDFPEIKDIELICV